ncbi:lectin, mannose-binding 2-like a isoform X1 [Denticeps clupeoides]|uniref:L-type lectin-like domain-containing protein n=1 Tax=Denticeps clupeoides TaxID=299321 RepID=A0AAY4CCQ7_9TELE|nr:VIP36-like protein isoform X1 [Denticeps clupeoides]
MGARHATGWANRLLCWGGQCDGPPFQWKPTRLPWTAADLEMSWVCLLIAATVGPSLADDGHEMEEFLKREYSLSKPYQGIGSSASSHWELMGDAVVSTDNIRLTPDVQSKQGAVWSRMPCHLKDWEIQVHFKIHGQGKKNLNGDGLAIWYTKERMQNGPVFGNVDMFTGLGVFVDTYPNEEKFLEAQKKRYTPRMQVPHTHTSEPPIITWLCFMVWSFTHNQRSVFFNKQVRKSNLLPCFNPQVVVLLYQRVFPYVLAMVGNGSVSYSHDRDGRPTELGGCSAIVRNLKHDTFLFIRYVRRRLTIMIDIDGQHEWRDCLDIPGVRLPMGYYFGASAVTGDLSDNHDLISLKLYQLTVLRSKQEEEGEEEVLVPSVDNFDLQRPYSTEEGTSGIAIFFTVLFSLLGCFLLIVVSLVLYGHWNESRRKRFY